MHKVLVLDRDDGLAAQLRALVPEFSTPVGVTACSVIGSVAEVLETEGPFEVLVAGPGLGTRSGLARLRIIAEELPGMRLVLAFARRPDASLRDIVRTGAVDLVQLPTDDARLLESVERAIGLAVPAPTIGPAVVTAPASAEADRAIGRPGRVLTVASATGGCGKTFYVTNLAHFLHRWTGQRVCIVDLDLQFGEVSTALRLRPKYTIYDALQREEGDDGDLEAHVEEYTIVHETGVHVLAAPREPSEADRIAPPDVTRIVEAVRAKFDYVLVDTPPALAETVLAAFDLSDVLYVMATLDLPSVRNMSVFLSTLDRLKVDSDNVRLILNKAEKDVGIDIPQVTKLFAQGFESVLPYAKEVSRSINLGMPVLAASPDAEISRLLTDGMKLLLSDELRAAVDAATAPTGHGIRRMFRR